MGFLAWCNVIALAVQYYITLLGNGHMYISQYCLEVAEDLVRKGQQSMLPPIVHVDDRR